MRNPKNNRQEFVSENPIFPKFPNMEKQQNNFQHSHIIELNKNDFQKLQFSFFNYPRIPQISDVWIQYKKDIQ